MMKNLKPACHTTPVSTLIAAGPREHSRLVGIRLGNLYSLHDSTMVTYGFLDTSPLHFACRTAARNKFTYEERNEFDTAGCNIEIVEAAWRYDALFCMMSKEFTICMVRARNLRSAWSFCMMNTSMALPLALNDITGLESTLQDASRFNFFEVE